MSKCLKAAKDRFTSAKLPPLHTQTKGRGFTKPWIGTPILLRLLTVTCFVLQYLPSINIFPRLLFPPFHYYFFSASVLRSPVPTLPGEGGAGSAADVGGGAEEARGGREEASGRGGPQAEAGGGGGEDERETLLSGQWSSGRREEDERRDIKRRLGVKRSKIVKGVEGEGKTK